MRTLSDSSTSTSSATVLVVDDEEMNRKIMSRFINALGCEVLCAENGIAALREVHRSQIDLILLDIMMPQIDGYSVLTRLKADPATMEIPVLVISALDDSSNVVRCIEAGADDFMTKPFNSNLLRARVQACLAKRRHLEKETEYRREVEANNLRLEQQSDERLAPFAESRRRLLLANNIQQDLLHRLSSTMGLEPRDPVSLSYFSQRSAEKDDPSPSIATESLLRAAQYIVELANESVSNPRESALVTDVLRQAIASIDDRARSKSVTIAAIPPVDVSVTGNAAILAEAFAIYFIKAIDWSAPGSRIEILFEVGNGRFITMLHSTGMFVPREELFETFDLRTEPAPTIPLDLGPPLARKVIEVFGGQLALDSMDDGIFQMIELPTAATD